MEQTPLKPKGDPQNFEKIISAETFPSLGGKWQREYKMKGGC